MFEPQLIQVSETIWCVRRPSYLTCSYIVKTSIGTVLVDAGMDSEGRDMQYGLAHLGLSVESVHAILLTHWHNDHAAGGKALQLLSHAAVYYHPDETPFFTRETAHPGLRGRLSDAIPEWGALILFKGLLGEATPVAVQADAFATDGKTVLRDFEVIATPGHTVGHVSYYYRPEKALFAGDALAVIGERIHFMARPVTLNLEQARDSMLRCLSLDIELLCPGHRAPLTQGVAKQCHELTQYIKNGGKWPLFG